MKNNKMMRIASVLLVAVLLSTCVISGTFAKYVTSTTGTANARVAHWGFEAIDNSIVFADLFKTTYDNVASSESGKNVIAPGTTGYGTFKFDYDNDAAAPEVAYTFEVSTEGSTCADEIQNNKNIIWYLNDTKAGTNGTWTELLNAIKALSGEADGSKEYAAGKLPDAFNSNQTIKISWEWKYDGGDATYNVDGQELNQDQYDTYMGNMDVLSNVTLKVTITATQID